MAKVAPVFFLSEIVEYHNKRRFRRLSWPMEITWEIRDDAFFQYAGTKNTGSMQVLRIQEE
jgi:hypothetical protein